MGPQIQHTDRQADRQVGQTDQQGGLCQPGTGLAAAIDLPLCGQCIGMVTGATNSPRPSTKMNDTAANRLTRPVGAAELVYCGGAGRPGPGATGAAWAGAGPCGPTVWPAPNLLGGSSGSGTAHSTHIVCSLCVPGGSRARGTRRDHRTCDYASASALVGPTWVVVRSADSGATGGEDRPDVDIANAVILENRERRRVPQAPMSYEQTTRAGPRIL